MCLIPCAALAGPLQVSVTDREGKPVADAVVVTAGEWADDPDAIRRAADWLVENQILEVVGDWADRRPGLRFLQQNLSR